MKLVTLGILLPLLLLPIISAAFDAKIEIEYRFENTNPDITISGFRFYFNGNPVHTETDNLVRVTTLFIPLENQSYSVTMTAYGTLKGASWESPHSTAMMFKYYAKENIYTPSGFMQLKT